MQSSSTRMSSTFTLPRVDKRPRSVGTHGPTVVKFCQALGVDLFDWQKHVIDAAFAVNDQGEWAANEFGLLVSRQNGKGEILVAYTLAHLFLFPRTDNRRKTILYSAHEVKTSDDGFERIRSIIEASPSLMARVAHIYLANGKGSIRLKPRKGQKMGDRVLFVARSKSSGRGFSGDVIIQDEAQEESKQAHTALTYTQSAVPNRQEFFCGTVPEEGVNDSEVFEGVRDRGRSEEESRTGWMEWSPVGSDDPETAFEIDFSDEDVWLEANPSAPFMIKLDTIQDQFNRDVSPEKEIFGRERLSIWPARPEVDESEKKNSDVDLDKWREGVLQARLGTGVVLAVAIGRGGGYSTIAGGQRLDDGRILLEHLDTRVQTLWVVDALAELKAKHKATLIVLDEKNCGPIIPDLQRKRIRFMAMNMGEVATAFDMFIEHNNAGLLAHPGQGEVAISLENAVPRVMSKTQNLKTWDQGDPKEPVTQVQAITLALWGVKKSESRPAPPPPATPAQVVEKDDFALSGTNVLSMRF